jgi:hypothetical protein
MIVSKVMSASLLAAVALAVPATAGEIHELLGPGSTRDIPRAQELLRSGPKLVSARDAHLQETPLHIVARFGPVEMVELLIRMKADVNATALQWVHAAALDGGEGHRCTPHQGRSQPRQAGQLGQDAAADGGPARPGAGRRGDLGVRVPVRPMSSAGIQYRDDLFPRLSDLIAIRKLLGDEETRDVSLAAGRHIPIMSDLRRIGFTQH